MGHKSKNIYTRLNFFFSKIKFKGLVFKLPFNIKKKIEIIVTSKFISLK